MQEQLRKKGRMARAAESYQAELLREGVCRILRYVAAVKQHRGCLQAQHQLQVKLEPGWQAHLSLPPQPQWIWVWDPAQAD